MPAPQLPTRLLVCLLLLSLAACAKDARVAGHPDDSDPCAIALSPDSDPTVISHQQRVEASPSPVPHLERLGWRYVELARSHGDPGFYLMAEQCARCIERHRPDSEAALLLRGHVDHSLHRFAAAERIARRLVDHRGRWFDHALLGDVLFDRGDLDAALDAYDRMMHLRPGPQAYSRAAQMRWITGDVEGAILALQIALRAAGRGTEAAAWMWTRLSLLLFQAGDLDNALDAARRGLLDNDDYAPAQFAVGRILLALGRKTEAIEALQAASRYSPMPDVLWALLEAHESAGDAAAADEVRSILHRTGAASDARTFALYLATRDHHPQLALRLALAELRDRRDVFTYDAAAWAFARAGDLPEALDHSDRSIAEGTVDARLFLHRALIHDGLGHEAEAEHWMRRAAKAQATLLPSERTLLTELRQRFGGDQHERGG